MRSQSASYHGYRFLPDIISHAVWLYYRFCLSFRDGIVKLSRIRLTDPQDDGLESRREPGMLGVDHRDSA